MSGAVTSAIHSIQFVSIFFLNVTLILKYRESDLSGVWQWRGIWFVPFYAWPAASHLISWTMLPYRATGFVLQRQGGFSDGQQVQTLHHPEASGHTGAVSRIHLIKHSLFLSSLLYYLPFEILWFLTGVGLWLASSDKTLFWLIYSSLLWQLRCVMQPLMTVMFR